MRFLIRHETSFRFEPAARFVNGLVRLTPRNHEGQFVAKWRLVLDVDGRMKPTDDGFGNIMHSLALAGPMESVTLRVEGEVSTFDAVGVVRGTLERFPPDFFLRASQLTEGTRELRSYCLDNVGTEGDPLARLHGLLIALNRDVAWEKDGAFNWTEEAAESVFAKRAGNAAGLAHLFIAGAHHLDMPARFACGYCLQEDGPVSTKALHSWAEAYVPGFGWLAFDPALCICPSDLHVRVAYGLDSIGAAPIRLSASGLEETTREETIEISTVMG
jgi:transglutaminase-like putative cysteine protease